MKRITLALGLLVALAAPARAWPGDPQTYNYLSTIYMHPRPDRSIRWQHGPTAAIICPQMQIVLSQGGYVKDIQYAWPSTTLCDVGNAQQGDITICSCSYAQPLHSAVTGTHLVSAVVQCPSGAYGILPIQQTSVSVPNPGALPFNLYGPYYNKSYFRNLLNQCGENVTFYDTSSQICVQNGGVNECWAWY